MKIAINTYPLNSAHKDRGIGYYTKNLIENLKKDKSIEVLEFIDVSEVKKVDLVHYPWFDFYFHTLPIRKIYPTIVTIHDVIPLIFKTHYPVGWKGKLNFNLQKFALKGCRKILTDSQTSKNNIAKYLKVAKEKIAAIYLAAREDFKLLSDTKLLHIKRQYNLPDQFLLYVGDANWVKNLPFLIEGFNRVVKKTQFSRFKLILVGNVFLKKVENINHPELESLKTVNRLISQFKLEDKIVRVGNLEIEELVGFYNLATIYIQPSLYEGFGLPVIEALSCGTPVVCSNSGSLPEVGGNAAIYFDPKNSDQFVSILIEVLQNKSLQMKLSKLGLSQAEKFSWEKFTFEMKQIYSEVAENAKT